MQCFDFFRNCTVLNTNLYVADEFWARDILQAAAAEPAIMHGVIALGALHRHAEARAETEMQYAIQNYAKAVSLIGCKLSMQGEEGLDINILLMSTVIFYCFDNQIGNRKTAAIHLMSGFRLAAERHASEGGESSKATRYQPGVDRILRTMRRLDVQDLTYSDANRPYQWDTDWTPAEMLPGAPAHFDDFEQARDALMILFKRASHIRFADFIRSLGQDPGIGSDELNNLRVRTLTDLSQWLEAQRQLLYFESIARRPSPHVLVVTEAYHKIAVMNLTVLGTKQECTWDRFVQQCGILVENIAAVQGQPTGFEQMTMRPFSYDLGTIAPTFWMAFKCRHPSVRRKAIALLSASSRQDGEWESRAAAAVAKVVIRIEESGLGRVSDPSDIPEEQRIQVTQPRKDFKRKTIECTFLTKPDGPEGNWNSITETIHYS